MAKKKAAEQRKEPGFPIGSGMTKSQPRVGKPFDPSAALRASFLLRVIKIPPFEFENWAAFLLFPRFGGVIYIEYERDELIDGVNWLREEGIASSRPGIRKPGSERVQIFSKTNGFVFNRIHNIQCHTPVENALAMFRASGREG